MGVDFRAAALVGVRIDKSDLYREERVRGCSHPAKGPEEEAGFCSVCGRPAWKTNEVPISGYNGDDRLLDLRVVVSEEDAYVCMAAAKTDSHRSGSEPDCIRAPDSEAVRKELRGVLKPLGLWDEDQFGLWAVLLCSC